MQNQEELGIKDNREWTIQFQKELQNARVKEYKNRVCQNLEECKVEEIKQRHVEIQSDEKGTEIDFVIEQLQNQLDNIEQYNS